MFISATNFPSKLLPQIHQNPQQQIFDRFSDSHFRPKGVAKTSCGTPMLHASRFLFWSPCSMGMRFLTFSTPPQRECDLFHFVNTSQARSSEIMNMAFSNHCVGVTLPKTPNVNRHKNPRLLWKEIYDTKIVLCKNLKNLFGIICFSNEFKQF